METDKCSKCNSRNLEKRNIKKSKVGDEEHELEVEFNLYCKACGGYVASFDWGHWEY